MLKATFCCFTGISAAAEQRLWQAGVYEWGRALKWPRPIFSPKKWDSLKDSIAEAAVVYEAGMLDYFLNRLSGVEKARVLPDVHGEIGYLDIETDGLGEHARITTIALHRAGKTRVFVRGRSFAEFLPMVASCGLLVTYNGVAFDLPRLRRHFKIDLGIPHLDLMHVLRAMGCRGGLKAAEKALGLERRYSNGTDGQEAVELWHYYEQLHDENALKRLMLYNAEDTLVLKELLSIAYKHTMSAYPGRMEHSTMTKDPFHDLPVELFPSNCSLTTE